jgi:hypothetical protein
MRAKVFFGIRQKEGSTANILRGGSPRSTVIQTLNPCISFEFWVHRVEIPILSGDKTCLYKTGALWKLYHFPSRDLTPSVRNVSKPQDPKCFDFV